MKLSCALLLLLALMGGALALKTYNGYQVLRTAPVPTSAVQLLDQLHANPHFEFWTPLRKEQPVDIMASPGSVATLAKLFRSLRLDFTVLIDDVGKWITEQRVQNDKIKLKKNRMPREATFSRYMDFAEIIAYLNEVVTLNPSIATLEDVATSFEGRPVQGVKISSGPGKRAVWFDCASHAREWATPPVCMKIIEEVLASTELQGLVDWYILPVANPDGYVFSWTDDRMWRKTRSTNAGSSCLGTDFNRNADYMWNANNNTDTCSDNYPGSAALSEPEVAGVADRVRALGQAGTAALYFAVHSYKLIFYYPYGSSAVPAPNAAALQAAGDVAAAAIAAVRGIEYQVFSESDPASFTYGGLDDYSFAVGGVPFSYKMELWGGDFGLLQPPEEILPVVSETWLGVEAMVRHIVALNDN